jgi:hypothetical protein
MAAAPVPERGLRSAPISTTPSFPIQPLPAPPSFPIQPLPAPSSFPIIEYENRDGDVVPEGLKKEGVRNASNDELFQREINTRSDLDQSKISEWINNWKFHVWNMKSEPGYTSWNDGYTSWNEDKTTYEGTIKDGMPHTYEETTFYDMPHGDDHHRVLGVLETNQFNINIVYNGEWKDGKTNGRGQLYVSIENWWDGVDPFGLVFKMEGAFVPGMQFKLGGPENASFIDHLSGTLVNMQSDQGMLEFDINNIVNPEKKQEEKDVSVTLEGINATVERILPSRKPELYRSETFHDSDFKFDPSKYTPLTVTRRGRSEIISVVRDTIAGEELDITTIADGVWNKTEAEGKVSIIIQKNWLEDKDWNSKLREFILEGEFEKGFKLKNGAKIGSATFQDHEKGVKVKLTNGSLELKLGEIDTLKGDNVNIEWTRPVRNHKLLENGTNTEGKFETITFKASSIVLEPAPGKMDLKCTTNEMNVSVAIGEKLYSGTRVDDQCRLIGDVKVEEKGGTRTERIKTPSYYNTDSNTSNKTVKSNLKNVDASITINMLFFAAVFTFFISNHVTKP